MRLAAVAVVSLLMFGSAAHAATPAEQFVQQSADSAVAILKDKSLDAAAREAKLRDFLVALLDLHRMAIFALGPAASSASPDDLNAYLDAYTQFAIANYDSEFGAYGGEAIQVTGSLPRSDSDFVVNASITDPAAPSDPPDTVSFRVLSANGKFSIVDASVQGVWFTIAQRDDFAGFLKQNDGSVAALTARLRDMAVKLRSGAAQPVMPGK